LNIATANTATTDKHIDSLLEKKVNVVTEGLSPNYGDRFYKMPRDNPIGITDFILYMITEINLSNHYINNNMALTLLLLSQFHNNKKSFSEMTREDI
jgi:hypothetical protein